jgi:excisionase family DNA binding protein
LVRAATRFQLKFQILMAERDIGFEPTTFSLGRDARGVPSSGTPSQVVPTIHNLSTSPVHGSQPVTAFTKPFVTRLLPGGRAGLRLHRGGEEYLLTVAEVADRLGVSTATIYKLCDRGDLVHIRVLNTTRIAPAALAAYLADSATSGEQPRRLR